MRSSSSAASRIRRLQIRVAHHTEGPRLFVGTAGGRARRAYHLVDQLEGYGVGTEVTYGSATVHQVMEVLGPLPAFLLAYGDRSARKLGMRVSSMGGRSHLRSVKRIAILASGSGSNAQRLVEHFHGHAAAEVVLIGSDQPNAGVLQRAWDLGVPSYLFNGAQLKDGTVLHELQGLRVDLVVLAGFLRLIPAAMVQAFPGRILNIHPALLPKYGGKGMYGQRVHEAVHRGG